MQLSGEGRGRGHGRGRLRRNKVVGAGWIAPRQTDTPGSSDASCIVCSPRLLVCCQHSTSFPPHFFLRSTKSAYADKSQLMC